MNGISTIPCLNQNSTIFKTINGDLTLFNKTLIATKDNLRSLETVNATVYNKNGVFNLEGLTISATKSVSSFTKLSNAFKAYNSNLSKSTQLQTAYIKAVGNQNSALGNYLAGLNGAKASMSGYIKSLVAAKAASIGLQVASIALNTAITMGVSLAISALVSQISKWIHAQEEARQKSVELTNSYKEQQTSLDSQIEKYKELKETLDKGNLSTDESRSIKEQLLEIQQSLIESYGDEASNIDLVNGKYKEQLGLLSELSKEKATDYVTENRDVFADAKEALEKIRTYNLGTVTSWNTYAPETEDQKRLIEYLETYSDLLDLTYSGASSRGVTATSVNLSVKADVENADEIMHQLAEDLEKYGKDNNIDVSGLLEGISGQLKKTWTDELTEYKTVYDEFMKAEIVRNDTLRPLYQESIKAVEDYNNALSTGVGVEEAKANLDSVQQSVQNATGELEGSQDVFNGIYDGINKDAEAAYNLGQAFENDKTVQEYAEQLRGLSDIDLKAINFDNDNTEKGEEAFRGLMETLGLTEEQVQSLIDKLIELGYVQGEVQGSTSEHKTDIQSTISSSISQIATQLEPQFAKLGEAYKAIFTDNGFTLDDVDNSMLEGLRKSFAEIEEEVGVTFDSSKLNSFFDALTDGSGTSEKQAQRVQQAFNDLATAYFYSTDTLAQLNEETAASIEKQLEELSVVNAKEIVYDTLNTKTEALALKEQLLAAQSDAVSRGAYFNVEAFLNQAGASETARAYLLKLKVAELQYSGSGLDVSAKIAELKKLAESYGQTAIAAKIANIEKNAEVSHTGVTTSDYQSVIDDINNAVNNVEIDFSGVGDGASGAGKDSADAYVKAFEEELADLQDLRDRGVIDEAEYLNRLRELYTRYFADRKEYLDEFNKYERQYLEGMKSLYDSALSGISKLLGNKIDAVQEEKDATISALEEERDARLEVIEAQKEQLQAEIDLIDEQIDAKQEIIDSISDEINKMREANEERKRQQDLMLAQYNLQKMLSQRTKLVYTESAGMVYRADTSGIRDAKQAVDDAQLEIDIAAKEKEISLIEDEIDLLEKQKDAIQDQIDALDKQSESIEKYYSKMIEQQEKMFDSMIKNLENQKSKWEELADIQEIAEAYSAIEQVFGELGYSVEDVLNGSEGAFEDFKSKYIAIMSDMNQNTSFQEGLEYASGVAKESFDSIVNDSNDVKNALSEIGSASTELEPVATAIENIGTSSSTASANTSQIADDMSTLNTNTTGLSDNLNGISDALSNMPEASKFDAIAESFSKLAEAIGEVANTLGVGTEGTVGGLLQALTDISEISLGGEDGQGTGIISQFNSLKSAVDGVSSAISGGGGSTGTSDGASTSSSPSMSAGAMDGGTGGLTGAIDAMKKATDEALGSGSEEDTEGEGTGAIGQFGQLKQAVDDVTTAIGNGEEGENTAEKDAANLIGAIDNLGTKTEEILVGGEDGGESGGVIGRFTEFKDVIGEANEHVTGISEGLSAIDGQEVECTIKVNIETNGALPAGLAKSTGTALDTMNLESAEYNAKYGKAHAEGTALVSGNWAVQSNEKQALLGELGYEIIVRNGRFFTVGENGAEMFPIKKGDIVFNHEQSKQLLKNGHISGRGKAYADGTVGNSLASGILRELQPGDHGYELNQLAEQLKNKMIDFGEVIPRITDIDKNVDSITKNMNSINNNNSMRQIYNTIENVNVTCPGITSDDVARQIGSALRKEFSGMSINAYQKMNVTR